jgi:hypothetical protein
VIVEQWLPSFGHLYAISTQPSAPAVDGWIHPSGG